jgi:preprotein translocase subunit SecB
MVQPPLQLKQYFFPRIHCEADPNFKGRSSKEENQLEVKVQSNQAHKKDNVRDWRVILDIQVSSDKSAPYKLDLQVTGLFEVASGYSEDKINDLIRITGTSILYSGAREFILGITSRGPWGPLQLPTLSFIEPNHPEVPKTKKPRKTKEVAAVKNPK